VAERNPKIEKAVALAHDPRDAATPTVLATGSGAVARQILDVAFASGVKVREDADLVEVLAALDVGEQIPIAALAAVAEILSHVYRWEADYGGRTAAATPTATVAT
jgi:flagellar biosynthesis protein